MRLRPLVPLLLALLALLVVVAPALGAGPGTTFLTGGLDLPAGATAEGESGSALNQPDRVAGQRRRPLRRVQLRRGPARPGREPGHQQRLPQGPPDRRDPAREPRERTRPARVFDRPSYDPTISDDGSMVAFRSRAALDPADNDGGEGDVYVRDLGTGVTTLASVADGGGQTAVEGGATTTSRATRRASPSRRRRASTPSTTRERPTTSTCATWRRAERSSSRVLPARPERPTGARTRSPWSATTADGSRSSRSQPTSSPSTCGSGSQVFVRDLASAVTYVASNQAGAPSTGGNGSADSSRHRRRAELGSGEVVVTYDDAGDRRRGVAASTPTAPPASTSTECRTRADRSS